jgi:hypothetical protein
VTNPYSHDQTFKVKTDLLHCYGPSTLSLPADGTGRYPVTILPMIMGLYTGTIIFYD